jgi:hypothetical protein
MPISHKHKAIFIHIPRTCGSSIEKALGIYGLKNDGVNTPCPEILFGITRKVYLQHLTILEIKDRINKGMFEEYFKFTFIRNPYDRIISEYFWSEDAKKMNLREFLLDIIAPHRSRAMELYVARYNKFSFRGHRKMLTFSKFLPEVAFPNKNKPLILDMDRHFKSQHIFMMDRDGEQLVDFVGRFENLDEDFGKICERLGLDAELSHISKTKHKHYRSYYDDETRELIHDMYKKDLEMFGYEF